MARRPKDRILKTEAELEPLTSQTRCRIIEIVEKNKAMTIREIAVQMGAKPVTLYRHIDKLVAAGLLLEAGFTGEGPSEAMSYRTASRTYSIRYTPSNPKAIEHLARIVQAGHRVSARETVAALRTGKATTSTSHGGRINTAKQSRDRDTNYRQDMGWLDAGQLKELNQHLDAIGAIFNSDVQRRENTRQIAITWSLRPLDLTADDDA